MTTKRIKATLLVLSIILISSCGVNVPDDKLNYTGYWEGAGISIFIAASGDVEYHNNINGNLSITAPIQEFIGDNFIVGILGIETTFVVNEPPHQRGGIWYITIDNHELHKIEE
jgi:hypothetical protein